MGTRVENTAAGEERAALVSQMKARLRMMVVLPVLGARGRTMAFRLSILGESLISEGRYKSDTFNIRIYLLDFRVVKSHKFGKKCKFVSAGN